MMGFGALGMTSWILGAAAVATIWGGLWWLLSAIDSRPAADIQDSELPASKVQHGAVDTEWEQPDFGRAGEPNRSAQTPVEATSESECR